MFDLDKLDLDPDVVGDCCWCNEPVYDDEDYLDGDDGDGVMHRVCHEAEVGVDRELEDR